MGDTTFERGAAYARKRSVLTLTRGDEGRLLLATVSGSRPKGYQTLVRHVPSLGPGEASAHGPGRDWSGRCSCPMQVDCKHVVAVLLTARELGDSPEEAPAAPASWERQLADLVSDSEDGAAGQASAAPLALQVETVARTTRYWPGSGQPSRLRLRPLVRGKSGRWVKTGASWRELENRYGRVEVDPDQREALVSLAMRARARQPGYLSSYSEPQIYLDDLGPGGWTALRTVRDSGVVLVSDAPGEPEVTLWDDPARLLLDLRQASPKATAQLSAMVRLPDEQVVTASEVELVGAPAHGCFAHANGRMLLAPFASVLDEPTARLLRQPGSLGVPSDDLPRFLAMYAPALRERADLVSSDGSVAFPEVKPPVLALRVAFEPAHRLRLSWGFAYPTDADPVLVPLYGRAGTPRHRRSEAALLDSLDLLDAVPGVRVDVDGQRRLVPDNLLHGVDAAVFVSDVLPVLAERDDVMVQVGGTPVEYEQVTEAPVIAVSTNDPDGGESGATDWFDLQVSVSVGSHHVPMAPLLTALARHDEHLMLDNGTWFRLDRPELAALRRLVDEARSLHDPDSDELRITRWQAGLWEELVELGVVGEQSERWSRAVQPLLNLTEIPTPEAPSGLRATLRPYQLEGYHWLSLLWDHGLGGVLADDMGLGKTLQTLAMVARAAEHGSLDEASGPVLVVAPTSVVATWASEAARFAPDLRVATVTETRRRSGQPLAEVTADAHLVVTSYAVLRLDDEAFRELRWSGLVLDEAQFVKNHRAKTYQAARRVPAPFRLAITGTPLENSLMDLWAILSLSAPGLFPDPQTFTEQYRRPIESGANAEQLAVLRRRIRPLMLRRTKEQVAPELPPKIEQTLAVALNPAHRRVYDKHLQRERQRVLGLIDDVNRNRVAIFRSLTLLRRLSLDASLVDGEHAGRIRSSKIDVLMEQLDDVVAEGHRALVFSQFTGFLGLVRARLDEAGVGYCYLDGRTRDRPRRIAAFTEGDDPVFLISLKAGGIGLTLTEADYVFVLDPWWNPAAEAQAVDRTHRIGQDKTVMVYRLVATDTIEQKVVALQQRKRDLFDKVVDDGAVLGNQLTADDIRGLFER